MKPITPDIDGKAAFKLIELNKGAFTEDDLILYCLRGSLAHGTYIPGDHEYSTDDIDLAGVYLAPVDYYIGIHDKEHKYTKGLQIQVGEYDAVFYEIRKYIKMCMTCNPSALVYLWTMNDHQLVENGTLDLLIGHRDLFLTKKIYHTFVNYAKQQVTLMMKKDRQGYMGEKRKKLVEKFGYDCRNASHVIRLLIMCREALLTGNLKVFRNRDHFVFTEIKTGVWPLGNIEKYANRLFVDAEDAYKISKLPEEPDYKKINKLMMDILKPHVARGITKL